MHVNKRKYADDVCVYSQMIRCTYVIYVIPSQIFSVVVAFYEDMLQIFCRCIVQDDFQHGFARIAGGSVVLWTLSETDIISDWSMKYARLLFSR